MSFELSKVRKKPNVYRKKVNELVHVPLIPTAIIKTHDVAAAQREKVSFHVRMVRAKNDANYRGYDFDFV